MPLELNLKIKGHELVEVYERVEKGTREVTEKLKLRMKGMPGDKGSKTELLIDPKYLDEFEIGDIATVTVVVKQKRLALKTEKKKAAAKDEAA